MADFEVGDIKNTLNQLKDKLSERQNPQWGIWDNVPAPPPRTGPGAIAAPTDAVSLPPSSVQMRPEQMPSFSHADERTVKSVNDLVNQARGQSNRTQAAGLYMQAIQWANNAKDPTLQAVSKVEYGMANLNWGFTQEGFKWLLEAGSNNPTLYNPQMNQDYLRRLAQAGMPQSAVDLLMTNGQKDPSWYLKDPDAARKLDAAMTGPASVAPPGTDLSGQKPRDPLAPPEIRPEQPEQQAGPWMRDQFNTALRSAMQERNPRNAFGLYKQAVDMADRVHDPVLQATGRIELGLALISWGSKEDGFKWLLDAGAKNPGIYDARRNQALVERLNNAGLPKQTIDFYMANGQRDPMWFRGDPSAAARLESSMRQAVAPVQPRPGSNFPSMTPLPQLDPPRPAPQPFQPHLKPSPFGG